MGCKTRMKAALSWLLSLCFFLVVLSEGVVLPHIYSFTYTNINVVIHKVRNKTFKLLLLCLI